VCVAILWITFPLLKTGVKEATAGGPALTHQIPMAIFMLISTALAILSFVKQLSLIPVLGLLTCLYLMTQLGVTNWARFLVWLCAGLLIYFFYGCKRSKLNPSKGR
jgi:hypothetical protein